VSPSLKIAGESFACHDSLAPDIAAELARQTAQLAESQHRMKPKRVAERRAELLAMTLNAALLPKERARFDALMREHPDVVRPDVIQDAVDDLAWEYSQQEKKAEDAADH
jgi:hypothetical protein